MSVIQPILENLAELGVYDFFMPFLLILAVVFGVLQSRKVISEEVSVNAVIAIAVSFLATYTLRGVFFTQLFGMAGMVIAAGVTLIILLALLGLKPEDVFGEKGKFIGGIFALVIVIIIFLYALGNRVVMDNESVMTIIFMVFIFLAVYFMATGGKK